MSNFFILALIPHCCLSYTFFFYSYFISVMKGHSTTSLSYASLSKAPVRWLKWLWMGSDDNRRKCGTFSVETLDTYLAKPVTVIFALCSSLEKNFHSRKIVGQIKYQRRKYSKTIIHKNSSSTERKKMFGFLF